LDNLQFYSNEYHARRIQTDKELERIQNLKKKTSREKDLELDLIESQRIFQECDSDSAPFNYAVNAELFQKHIHKEALPLTLPLTTSVYSKESSSMTKKVSKDIYLRKWASLIEADSPSQLPYHDNSNIYFEDPA